MAVPHTDRLPVRRHPHWTIRVIGSSFAFLMVALTAVLLYHLLLYTPHEQASIKQRQEQILRILCAHSYVKEQDIKECQEFKVRD